MKTLRNIFVLALLGILCSIKTAHAQEIGARFGDALGNKGSVAIDAVFSLGKFSRVHSDISFGNGVGVEVLWDFIYRPISDSPINYYIGFGPSLYLGDPFCLGQQEKQVLNIGLMRPRLLWDWIIDQPLSLSRIPIFMADLDSTSGI